MIGLTNEYFSSNLVTRTVLKGMFNGLLMTLFVLHGINGYHVGMNGHNGDLWVSGTLIYAIVVVNANLFVMQRTSTHTVMSTIFLTLSVASFFLCFYMESMYPWSGPLYRLFSIAMTQKRVWLIFILAFWQNTALDMMFTRWRRMKREFAEEDYFNALKANAPIIEASDTEEMVTEVSGDGSAFGSARNKN